MSVRLAPSLLSADFAHLSEAISMIERGGADVVHLDVMDGHFVPNITIGPPVVKALRRETDLPFDCHLMIEKPQRYIPDFLEAGANMISVHVEADRHLHRALAMIRDGGAMAGIAINPATAIATLDDAIDYCDYVLVMSVNPGFGGQKFIRGAVDRIRVLSELIRDRGLNVTIEVDGGIDEHTASSVVQAGARLLVAGSAIFGRPDPVEAMGALRTAATGETV